MSLYAPDADDSTMAIAPGGPARRAARHAPRREDGSTLVEVLVAAALLLILAMGVLQALDHAEARGSEQKAKAIAGNLAQAEQERLRALPLTELSNNHSVRSEFVNGVTFDIESRAEWVTDATGEANCATGGASADYLRITSTVDSAALRAGSPLTLDSIMAPPARAFTPTEGSLSVQITDRNGDPVEGQTLELTGDRNVSGVTNAQGCVLWGYLPADNDYTLAYSSPGWIDPSGATAISATQSVAGEQTRNVVFTYDRGGTLSVDFTTTRMSDGAHVSSAPAFATIEHPGPPATLIPYPIEGSQLETPLLFPFTSPYSVYADNCTHARPSIPAVETVLPGQNTAGTPILLPSLDVKVVNGAAAVSGATVSVLTACGTSIDRTTTANGRLADPGYPFGTGLHVCVSNGTVERELTLDNTTLPGQDITVDLAGAPAGVCS
jgi:Tfp pilus assembly protein PilV